MRIRGRPAKQVSFPPEPFAAQGALILQTRREKPASGSSREDVKVHHANQPLPEDEKVDAWALRIREIPREGGR